MLLLHSLATLLMAGMCLFIAVAHYPMFRLVPREAFGDYGRAHVSRASVLIGPLMLIELATCIWLVAVPPPLPAWASPWWPWANAAALGAIWVITFASSAPIHAKLISTWSDTQHRTLLVGHAIRTAIWFVRGVICLMVLAHT
jgi:hypothetical protein